MDIESKIFFESGKLLDSYFPYYFEKYPRSKSQFKAKFGHYFTKMASLFCIREGYDAESFIKASMLDGFKFPQQLCNEQAWEIYKKYLPAIKKKSPDEEVVEGIVSAWIELRRYGGVKEWLALSANQAMVIGNTIKFNPTILAFSSGFINFCRENCPGTFDFVSLRSRVLSLKSARKVVDKIKKVLYDDYYLFDKEFEAECDRLNFVF